jgi:hypothetical protein
LGGSPETRHETHVSAVVGAEIIGTRFAIGSTPMLRIANADPSAPRRLMLEGQLVGPWVDELYRVTLGLGAVDGFSLDLRNVTFADHAGVALLRRLRAYGAVLVGCSSFLTVLIGGGDDEG